MPFRLIVQLVAGKVMVQEHGFPALQGVSGLIVTVMVPVGGWAAAGVQLAVLRLVKTWRVLVVVTMLVISRVVLALSIVREVVAVEGSKLVLPE